MSAIPIVIFLALLVGLHIFRTRRAAAREQLQHDPADLRWRVRYTDGKVSRTFNRETADSHRQVFGGKVIPAESSYQDFQK